MASRFLFCCVLLVVCCASANAAYVQVPSAWNAEGWWVDTGLDVSVGDVIRVVAQGQWSADVANGGYCGPDGHDSSFEWVDQFLNPDYWPGVRTHMGVLIGFIGQNPPQIGSYADMSVEERRACIAKMVTLGSDATQIAPVSGRLFLGMNDDAYSAASSDNAGSVTATVQVNPNAEVRITADNNYWLWVNPGVLTGDGTTDSGFVGCDYVGKPGDGFYESVEGYPVTLETGFRNTILVKATNQGTYTPGNPAAMIARTLLGSDTVKVTDASWGYCTDADPSNGTWHSPSVAMKEWDTGVWPWVTTDSIREAFTGCDAMWIWSEPYQAVQSDEAWFRTNIDLPVYNPANGHYYMAVKAPEGIAWNTAAVDAQEMTFQGRVGHLATVTSADEQVFLNTHIPDLGTSLWLGGVQPYGSAEPSGGWRWITGEGWSYTNWHPDEPNNTAGAEDALEWRQSGPDAGWNDRGRWVGPLPQGYVVEFDGWRPAPVRDPANGHYYQTVSVPSRLDWFAAKAAAESTIFMGARGHLATLTTAAENDFVLRNTPIIWTSYWAGGFRSGSSSDPSVGWSWVNGEAWGATNWFPGEPNGLDEDGLEWGFDGMWNNRPRTYGNMPGYIVEFEPPMPIGGTKSCPEGTFVFVNDAVVTAGQSLVPGSVFVESRGRSSGIRVITDEALGVGQRVAFTGCVSRVDGEWRIGSPTFSSISTGGPLAPLGLTTRALGNDPSETLSYTGIITTGLLVRLCGRVTAVVPPENTIYVDDGAGCEDGLLLYVSGIHTHFPEGLSLPAKGSRVIVTGVSRVEKQVLSSWAEVNGVWYRPGTTVYVPSVWVRDAQDLSVL